MKKIALLLITFVMAQAAMAQTLQFSLPIMPEKMWPSDYAKYEGDVLNCCNWLLEVNPEFNQPKHEECAAFLVRWLAGTPDVRVLIDSKLVDVKNQDLLVTYIAAWTRQAINDKNGNALIYANVAEEEMLRYYTQYQEVLGKSKLTKKLLKQRQKGKLPVYVADVMKGYLN